MSALLGRFLTLKGSRDGRGQSAALAAMLPQASSAWDWLPRLPKWLDPLSTTIALKTCVGLVIGVSIALWLGWSATGVGFACIMLQTAYLGRTLGRSILRMAGALVGALLALAFVATFVQERAALIAAYALLTGLIIYLEQVSEHPYALLFVLLSVGLITFATINEPQRAFSEAVSWVSGNALGVTIVLFMHGVLWPHTGEKSFEQQLRTFTQGLAHLFTLKMAALPQAARERGAPSQQAVMAELHELESRLVGALAQLRLALGIAARDTSRFIRFEAAYAELMDQLQLLTNIVVAYGDSLRVWRDTPLAEAVIPLSPAPHAVMAALQEQLDGLVSGCESPRDGSAPPPGQDAPDAIAAQTDQVRSHVASHEHSVLEVALFDAVAEKAVYMSQAIARVSEILATAEQPGRHAARARPIQIDVITRIQSHALRLQKAAIGTIAVIAASLLWIYLQWPDPGSLLVYVLLPVALNAMVPTFPVKGALKSLFWGPLIGAVLYFLIMPLVNDMWQLAPLLVLCLLPTTYLTNSANPATMMLGLLSSLWAFVLIDISQGQAYSFSQFSNTTLGILGGVGTGLVALVLLNPPVPERQFRTYARTFLQRCEKAIGDLRSGAARAAGGGDAMAARQAESMELLGLCELWARHLDHDRHDEGERGRLAAFLESLQSLAFRLDALVAARERYPDEALIEAPAQRCCARATAGMEQLRRLLSASAQIPDAETYATSSEDFRATLEPLHAEAHEKGAVPATLHQTLILTGYYCALTDAVQECLRRAEGIDWRAWDLAYF